MAGSIRTNVLRKLRCRKMLKYFKILRISCRHLDVMLTSKFSIYFFLCYCASCGFKLNSFIKDTVNYSLVRDIFNIISSSSLVVSSY